MLADEIRAGNIRAVLNFGGHLLTAFPEADDLEPTLRDLEVLATTEIIANDTTALSTHVLPTKDQLERADVTLWDFLSPRVAAQHTPAVVDAVGDRRSSWWVIAELGRRLGHALAPDDADDDVMLARIGKRARCSFDELVDAGWVEVDHDVPAPWVDAHVERLGGWRLAPRLLVDQLARLVEPAALVLVPRRQVRHLNSQFAYLDEPATVVVHPDDASRRARARRHPRRRAQRARCDHRDREGRRRDPAGRGVRAPRPPGRQRQPAHQQGRPRPDHRHGDVLRHPRDPRARGAGPG